MNPGKWSPPLHPRDKRGRFTSSGTVKTKSANKAFLENLKLKAKPMKSGADADGYIQQYGAGNLTPSQKESVTSYVTDAATQAKVNASLRAKNPNPEVEATTKDLEGALKPLPDDLVLNRTVSEKTFGQALEDLPGMTVQDAAFTSTSLGVSLANGPGTVQVKIAAPKGTPAIIVGDLSGHPEDREVLLGPGQELAITSVTPNANGGHTMAAVALPSAASTSSTPELDAMKAQADKLGPHSKAAADYRAARAKHDAELAAAPKAEPAAPAKPKLSLADIAGKLGTKPATATPAPSTPKTPDVPPAAKVTAKPAKTKSAPVTAEHKKTSLDGLSSAELAGLKLYSGDDYRGINGGLRDGKVAAKYKPVVASIDSAIASAPLAQPTKVYRTVGGGAFGLSAGSDPSSLKGRTFTEAGFMSTSTTNQRFPVTPPPVHFTVEVPAGVGGAYLEPITVNPTENELLLPRGLNYVVTNVRKSAKGGWTATARIIPPTG